MTVETAEQHLEVRPRVRPRRVPARVLLTNDDGIGSPGLHELALSLGRRHDLLVVAPEDERSGAGTGIGYFEPARGVEVTPVEMDGWAGYSIAGPPGLAVMSAMLGAFGEAPDVVVSGINAGINTGHSVLHSGTVGAVLTARTFGCDGVAVSVAASDPWQWETAAAVAMPVVDWVLARAGTISTLNLNVPALPLSETKGIVWADLDEFGFFRVALADLPGRRLQFEVGAPDAGLDPASDTALVRAGYATLTPLTSVEPAPFPDSPGPALPSMPEGPDRDRNGSGGAEASLEALRLGDDLGG